MAVSTGDLYEKAMALSAQSIDESFMELGKSLRQLLDRDPDLFKQVVDRPTSVRAKRTTSSKIARAFQPLPIPRNRLLALGWTKLEKISKHVSKQEQLARAAHPGRGKQHQAD